MKAMTDTTTDSPDGPQVSEVADTPGADATPRDDLDVGQDTDDTELEDTTLENRNAEAAKYRRRARDAEGERDRLRDQLDTMRRAEAERIAGEHVAKGEAIWAAGVELDELLDDDGRVDAEKVSEAVASARSALGLEARPRIPKSDPSQGARSPVPSGPSIVEAFQPPHQRGRG